MMKKSKKIKTRAYNVKVGDRFYFNNYCTKRKLCLPDYLTITKIIPSSTEGYFFIEAQYENHSVYTAPVTFSSAILDDSNLNPAEKNPKWYFVVE